MRFFLFYFLILLSCTGKRSGSEKDKIIVLTFDDAVRSQLTVVAPILKKYDFNATFFVTYAFMDDTVNFLTWNDIAELYRMGFEIGNHSWTHPDFSQPSNAAGLAGELGLVNYQLMTVGVPPPVSFAWTGNGFGPEALGILEEQGIRFARRGMQPEVEYGNLNPGPVYDPDKNHRLLIPTTRDAYPDMRLSDFKKAVRLAGEGEVVVLQFHGVPDPVHPWVNTDPVLFEKCMEYLHDNQFRVIAMKDLESLLPATDPADPLVDERHVLGDASAGLEWPDETLAMRADRAKWISIMEKFNYTHAEMARVFGWTEERMKEAIRNNQSSWELPGEEEIRVLPYPGGRHPRIGFREGMLSPMRGTKLGIFLPWHLQEYVVLDLPEAIFSQFGLTFLAHKHIPTVFDLQKKEITNRDWTLHRDGHLTNRWDLPNRMVVGAEVYPRRENVDMSLWIYNGTEDTTFTGLQTQICIMTGSARDFNLQTNENKIFADPVVAVRSEQGDRWILTAWEQCNHAWGNEDCPCMHSDPILPDCPPGDTVRVSGKIWFSHEKNPEIKINKFNAR